MSEYRESQKKEAIALIEDGRRAIDEMDWDLIEDVLNTIEQILYKL